MRVEFEVQMVFNGEINLDQTQIETALKEAGLPLDSPIDDDTDGRSAITQFIFRHCLMVNELEVKPEINCDTNVVFCEYSTN